MGLFLHTAPYRAAQVTEPGPPLTKSKDMKYEGAMSAQPRVWSLLSEGRGEERWPGGAEGWPGAQGTTTRDSKVRK